jgi:transposase
LHMYRRDDRESALTQRPMAQMKTELDNSKEELRRVVEERKQAGEEVRLLRDKLQKLSTQNIDNNSSNNNNNNNNKTPPSTPRGLELKSRLDSLNRQHESFRQEMATRMENKNRAMQQMQKERRAIQTIMERKIKTLTDNIAAALAAITKMSTNGGAPLNDLNNSNAAHTQRLSREVLALQRLVNAAITALRNAETENA